MSVESPARLQAAIVPPSQRAIEIALEPSITRRFSAHDAEWRQALAAARRDWFWPWVRTRLVPGPLRRQKQVASVARSYASVWTSGQLPGLAGVDNAKSLLRWSDAGVEVRGFGEKRVHLLLLQNTLAALSPRNVLEVGSGNGFMSMLLASAFPAVSFAGVELTAEGVAAAHELQQQGELASALREFAPFPIVDPMAFKRVAFQQGDATALPFEDKRFDVVFTSLALEQMKRVLDGALAEIRRVARCHVVMLEPFRDFNQEPEQRYYTQARDYLDLPVRDLPRYGLRASTVFADFPSKIHRGAGLVIAEPV